MADQHPDDDLQDAPADREDADLSALCFRVAFECAPLGMMVLQDHTVVACNQALCDLFERAESHLLGTRFNHLFPGSTSFEAVQAAMREVWVQGGRYRETRLIQPLGPSPQPADSPMRQVSLQFVALDASQRLTLCSVESASVPLVDHDSLTPREREVASLLRERYTAKEIGRSLGISHRTVEIYRTRLMKKYGVRNAAGLVRMLLREPGEPEAPEPAPGVATPAVVDPVPRSSDLCAVAQARAAARPAGRQPASVFMPALRHSGKPPRNQCTLV